MDFFKTGFGIFGVIFILLFILVFDVSRVTCEYLFAKLAYVNMCIDFRCSYAFVS